MAFPKTDTTHFLRRLTPEQRAILLAAGSGNITRGFHEVLDFFAHFYELGFRPWMPHKACRLEIEIDQSAHSLKMAYAAEPLPPGGGPIEYRTHNDVMIDA